MRVRIPPRALFMKHGPASGPGADASNVGCRCSTHLGATTPGLPRRQAHWRAVGTHKPEREGSSPSAGTERARSNGKTPARHAGDNGFNSRGAHHAGLGYWLFIGPTRRRCRFDSCTPYRMEET